jgi:hypothetical protein
MFRLFTLAAGVALFALAGCDNRTEEAVRWDQIAKDLKKGEAKQPFTEADAPWSNDNHHTGTPW